MKRGDKGHAFSVLAIGKGGRDHFYSHLVAMKDTVLVLIWFNISLFHINTPAARTVGMSINSHAR